MPQSKTVTGAAGGAAIGVLAEPIYQVSHALVTWNWTPEAQAGLARIVAAIMTAALGILAMARDRIADAIESGELPELDPEQRGALERAATSLGIRFVRRGAPKVVPEDEPGPMEPLDRSGGKPE